MQNSLDLRNMYVFKKTFRKEENYEVQAIHMKYFAKEENKFEKRKWLDFFIGDLEAKQALATQ